MKRTLATMFAALALSAPAVKQAHAMDYTYKVLTTTGAHPNDFLAIYAKGEILYEEGAAFDRFVKQLPANAAAQQTVVVFFNSDGGNVVGGFGVGDYIRKAGWRTAVDDDAQCASACVVAWGASTQKFASSTARLGIHSVTFDGSKLSPENKAQLKETDDVYAAVFTLAAAQQLKVYGAPDSVVVKAITTTASDIYWLNGDDAKAWNVTITQPRPKALGTPTASIN